MAAMKNPTRIGVGTLKWCVPSSISMKKNLSIVRELAERPSAQQLLIHLPIEPFVLAAWMSHPEVQAWALSMSPEARHNAIQKAIDGKLAEVKNIA